MPNMTATKMCIILFLIALPYNTVSYKKDETPPTTIGPTLRQQLDLEHRNSLCCTKKMKCCKRPKPPNIELRAVLARCTRPPFATCRKQLTKTVVNKANEFKAKSFEGFDDEPLAHSIVSKCQKKVVLTIKIKNEGRTNTKSQFIVVDHVYDPISSKTVRLLNPYVLKLKQEHVSQTYPLKFLDFVNSEAKEHVYNKHDGNYTGCSTEPRNATCGVVRYKGKVIPFSQGFCCSCDAQKNFQRQPETLTETERTVKQSDPAYLFDSVQCSRMNANRKNQTQEKRSQESDPNDQMTAEYVTPNKNIYQWSQQRVLEDDTQQYSADDGDAVKLSVNKLVKAAKSNSTPDGIFSCQPVEPDVQEIIDTAFHNAVDSLRLDSEKDKVKQPLIENEVGGKWHRPEKRQVQSSGVQKRGGQNCADRYTPHHLDKQAYHESTHCLRFSPVWYGVYKLDKPIVEQEIIVQIFEKYETDTGKGMWKDLTNGRKVKLGTFCPFYQDETPTVSFSYEYTSDTSDFCLNFEKFRLLVPEGLKQSDKQKYPETSGGAKEFLLINKNKIFLNGEKCDVAGVGFQAFHSQPNRCSMPRGTCLRHQPKHMWLHDKKMERLNKHGCYFLKYHAALPQEPVRVNMSNGEKYLMLNYYGKHVSIIEMEINADFNAVLRTQTTAVITEVYIDSTSGSKTYITVKVTNSGLLSSSFFVRIDDCPLDIKSELHDIRSKLILISPQNQHIFKLTLKTKTNIDIFFCSVEAVNSHNELVSLRRIRIQKFDRCICSWHCLCTCIGTTQGLKCIPMQVEHYHAAGFLGGLPVISYVHHFNSVDDILSLFFYFLLFILFTLFVLGLTKALIGLCCLIVGVWGLNVLLDLPKPMNRYYETNLRKRIVIYDEEGWPVDPDTGAKVRNIPLAAEFCTNVIFFYTYPCIMLLLVSKKLCCPFYTYERLGDGAYRRKRKGRSWFRKEYECGDAPCHPNYCPICQGCDGTALCSYGQKFAEAATQNDKMSKAEGKTKAVGDNERKKTTKAVDGKEPIDDNAKNKSKDGRKKKTEGERTEAKRKPAIKVSIKEPRKNSPKSTHDDVIRSTMEISDNPYYDSSTASSRKSGKKTRNKPSSDSNTSAGSRRSSNRSTQSSTSKRN